ncbi:MAG: YbaB/EbfC family DNA-binding protein [Labedaea sp.]
MIPFNQLYALVQEIEADAARLDEAAAQARKHVARRQIDGQLGLVTVSGDGELIEVGLDRQALRYLNGQALGTAVLRAITMAESDLRAERARTMSAARRTITT